MADIMELPGRVLILVENFPVPFDRRVWLEATALRDADYLVSVICPDGGLYSPGYEYLDGIHVYRYKLSSADSGFWPYAREYATAMVKTLMLSCKIIRRHGFDVIHACNPPDLFFLIGWFFRPLGKRFVFDVHDLSPETYRVQNKGREGIFYRVLLLLEWLSFASADVVVVTNESVRRFARVRGRVGDERLFVVRTGPDFQRLKILPSQPELRCGARYLVVYVGVMGPQDGVDYALRAAKWLVCHRNRRDIHFAFVGSGPMLSS